MRGRCGEARETRASPPPVEQSPRWIRGRERDFLSVQRAHLTGHGTRPRGDRRGCKTRVCVNVPTSLSRSNRSVQASLPLARIPALAGWSRLWSYGYLHVTATKYH